MNQYIKMESKDLSSDKKQSEHKSNKALHKLKLSQNDINTFIKKITSFLLEQKEITIDSHFKKAFLSSKEKSKLLKHSEQITDLEIITHIFTQSSSNSYQLMECLNSLRYQLIIMQIPQFEFVVNVFMKILDRYAAKDKKLNEKRLSILDYIIILSQTFHCEKSTPDTIMSNYIGQHCIWKEKIWSSLIKRFIEKEKKTQKKNGIEFNREKEMTLVTSTLVTYKFIIKSFHKNEGLCIKNIGKKYKVDIPEI